MRNPIILSGKDIAFFRKRERRASGCWTWTGKRNPRGRGRMQTEAGVWLLAPRVAFFLETGNDPGELSVLHTCDNDNCIRPGHLYTGTQVDNMRDMVARGRWRQGGSRVGDLNPNSHFQRRLRAAEASYAR